MELEKRMIVAVPVPSVPYDYWDEQELTGKGILSMRHAGYLAGLGVMGRNSLLYHYEYGNLIKLGALLVNTEIEPDPVQTFTFCSDSCNLCVDSCPVNAISNSSVNQKKCRPNSEKKNKRGVEITVCHTCRSVCPYRAGIKKGE